MGLFSDGFWGFYSVVITVVLFVCVEENKRLKKRIEQIERKLHETKDTNVADDIVSDKNNDKNNNETIIIDINNTKANDTKANDTKTNDAKTNVAITSDPITSDPITSVPGNETTIDSRIGSEPVMATASSQKSVVPQEKKRSSINAIFAIGVLLVTVAGGSFVSFAWSSLNDIAKAIMLLVADIFIFLSAYIGGAKIKLKQTSFALYTLGSLLSVITIYCFGYFEFFGSGFGRDNWYLVYTIMGACLLLFGVLGYKLYKSVSQIAISYLGLTWTLLFIALNIGGGIGFTFSVAVIAFVANFALNLVPDSSLRQKIRSIPGLNLYCELMTYFAIPVCFYDYGDWGVLLTVGAALTVVSLFGLIQRRAIAKYLLPVFACFVCFSLSITRIVDSSKSISFLIFLVSVFAIYLLQSAIKKQTLFGEIFTASFIELFGIIQSEYGLGGDLNPIFDVSSLQILTSAIVLCVLLIGIIRRTISKGGRVVLELLASGTLMVLLSQLGYYTGNGTDDNLFVIVASTIVCLLLSIAIVFFEKIRRYVQVLYFAFVGGSMLMVISADHYPRLAALALFLMSVMLLLTTVFGYVKISNKVRRTSITTLLMFILTEITFSWLLFCMINMLNFGETFSVITVATLFAVITAVFGAVFDNSKLNDNFFVFQFSRKVALCNMILASLFLVFIANSQRVELYEAIWSLVVCALLIVIMKFKDMNYLQALPILGAILLINSISEIIAKESYDCITCNPLSICVLLAGAIVAIVVGYFFYGNVFLEKKSPDFFTALSIIPLLAIARIISTESIYAVMFAIYCAVVSLKLSNATSRRWVRSFSVFSLAIAIVHQNAIPIWANIEFTTNVVVYVGAMAIVLFAIKAFGDVKGKITRTVWFITIVIAVSALSLNAMDSGLLFDLLCVCASGIALFIFSFSKKTKSWFILSLAVFGGIGVFFAESYWGNTLWLLIVLLLGATLIAIASVNEYKKHLVESGVNQNSGKRFFEDWKW